MAIVSKIVEGIKIKEKENVLAISMIEPYYFH